MYSNNKTVMFILQRSYTGILIPHYIGLLKQAGVHDYGKRPDRSRQMHPLLRSRSRPRARYSACGASSPYGKATHDDLSVASLLRYGCHQLTTIYASLRSFKLCSLVQLMFAAAPQREPSVSRFPLCGKSRTAGIGGHSCGAAAVPIFPRFALNAPPQPSAAPPEGEPSVSCFPLRGKSREAGLGVHFRGAAATYKSCLPFQFFNPLSGNHVYQNFYPIKSFMNISIR